MCVSIVQNHMPFLCLFSDWFQADVSRHATQLVRSLTCRFRSDVKQKLHTVFLHVCTLADKRCETTARYARKR